ncbi:F-box/kelch-repeat protein At3g23880-like [Papaver somniferum]|uniref:F-box/kelch-repeat protein At3g23880-like n=1 Tax=Papaver somniferum TaxID=3469 RepID=UPI000E6F683C|nr:F-box/kelch-repeat protein At3g23880-like [Papaver somniferum]
MCRMRYVYEIGCGFGYDCGIQDYKVVAIVDNKNTNCSDVEVYTLGLDPWRRSSSIPYRLAKGGPAGVFFNGALHWLAQSCSGTKLQVLLSFDMKDEIFVEIHQPENLDKFDYKFVGVLGGCLSMLCSVGKVGFEVWVMQDYGVTDSWTTLEGGLLGIFCWLHCFITEFVYMSYGICLYGCTFDQFRCRQCFENGRYTNSSDKKILLSTRV